MKKIAVVGPIPRDHIVTHQGDLIQKWGCVTHPVIDIRHARDLKSADGSSREPADAKSHTLIGR